MDKKQALDILQRYTQGLATPEETELIEHWYARLAESSSFDCSEDDKIQLQKTLEQRLLHHIEEDEQVFKIGRKAPVWRRYGWAAAVLLLLPALAYLLIHPKEPAIPTAAQQPLPVHDFAPPQTSNALLTLADGRTIDLDSTGKGLLALPENVRVFKQSDGLLRYEVQKTAPVSYHTLTVPKGGKPMSLVLSEGTQVWLNVASSITFPTAFTGKERSVEMSGEVYFEVAHDAQKPFYAKSRGMEVKVLGTRFNVNAYSDESTINTTLLEGKVEVRAFPAGNPASPQVQFLQPGQQARLGESGIQLHENVNLGAVMAWKNGYFSFEETDLSTLMRQLSRWYNVGIVYAGKIPDRKFGGEISRNNNLSAVLRILEESKVYCQVESDRIVVLPYKKPQ